jgi:hypothetical protein
MRGWLKNVTLLPYSVMTIRWVKLDIVLENCSFLCFVNGNIGVLARFGYNMTHIFITCWANLLEIFYSGMNGCH